MWVEDGGRMKWLDVLKMEVEKVRRWTEEKLWEKDKVHVMGHVKGQEVGLVGKRWNINCELDWCRFNEKAQIFSNGKFVKYGYLIQCLVVHTKVPPSIFLLHE